MERVLSYVAFFLFLVLPCGLIPGAHASTLSYLQTVLDRFQQTIDVYTDADAAGNHFAARGEFDNLSADRVAVMDEISSAAPCYSGITCITASFDPSKAVWGGWYFLNGVLGPTDAQPSSNWGNQPNAGFDLTGSTVLQFWARGAVGGEVVHFFAFGVGNTAPPFQPYPDSSAKVELPQGAVVLSTNWTMYQIPLNGQTLHYVLGGFAWLANAVEFNRMQPQITFYIDNIQYVNARPNAPRYLVSYETIKSTNAFDSVMRNAAFIYDNSVALIGLLGTGDTAHAQYIANGFLYAQGNDRFFTDGRLRNAYQGGDISLPPGWLPDNRANTVRMPGWYDAGHTTWYEDSTQVSTNTGNIAWAALALLDMWEVTKTSSYLTAAQTLGTWVLQNTSETRGGGAGTLGGFTGGYDGWENGAASGSGVTCASNMFVNGQCKRLYKSTEHNIDLYSVFSRLYLADGNRQWANAAQQAKHLFVSMWDPQEGKFWTGTAEDGATISKDVIPLDIQAWSLESLGSEAQPYLQTLAYVESHHKTSLGYGFKQNGGNSCGDWTWFEGTSQVALAYLLANNQAQWQSILNGVHSVQESTGGVPATDGPCLNTGFTLDDGSAWLYYPRVHVGATGWLALAENGINPYKASLYSPALSSSTVPFGNQSLNNKATRTFTLSNPGATPLNILSATISGTNAADFSQSNCGSTVPSVSTCTFTVSFTPTATGMRSATLTISESSDPAMAPVAFSVSLTGNGVPVTSSFVLTLGAVPTAGGTISATPASSNGSYTSGTTVCLTATPNIGWSFAGWSASLDSNGCLVMSANEAVTANFTQLQLDFYTLAPCRIMDTRVSGFPSGFGPPAFNAAETRPVDPRTSPCGGGIPADVAAYFLNFTVVPPTGGLPGNLSTWPAGLSMPNVSSLNYSNNVVAGAAIVPAGPGGTIEVFVNLPTHVIIDISGYFAPPASGGTTFFVSGPCRIADTRIPSMPPGFGPPSFGAGETRPYSVLSGPCSGLPSSVSAYSLNFTVVPPPTGSAANLTTWPAGSSSMPNVSTLNYTGYVVANAALLPTGTNGAINVFAIQPTNVLFDINGYFAPQANGLHFYALTPCRVADTRVSGFPAGFGPPSFSAGETRQYNVLSSSCSSGIPTNVAAYSLNFAAVPPSGGPASNLTTWPAGATMPNVSTLNFSGNVVSNMAIVPATASGAINVFVNQPTHVLFDINGYFAP